LHLCPRELTVFAAQPFDGLRPLSSVVRLALFYAALFAALGVQLPFLPAWLAAKGLDVPTIGWVLAVPMVVRVMAIPLATHAADHYGALRAVIATAAVAALLSYAATALTQGVVAITVGFALASAFYTPLMPLADAYALRGLRSLGHSYGPVRLWGSAAFIGGSFAAGFLLDFIPARELIWIIVLAMALMAAAAFALAPLAHSGGAVAQPLRSARTLWQRPGFVAVAAAAGLIQASHAVYYGFATLEWQAAGLGGGEIGALWAIAVLAEIALFAVSGRLPIAPTGLLVIGAAGAVIRWSAMVFEPLPPMLLPLQCLHALSFGATHLAAVGFVARAAPAQLGATAQGHLAAVLGLIMAGAMGLSGVLYARWASLAYVAMAGTALAGGLFALAAHRISCADPKG
jgi:MFS transporter, PPP family, 3-phenylpropionic acid transporter